MEKSEEFVSTTELEARAGVVYYRYSYLRIAYNDAPPHDK
jgi:hypothetical protein